MLKFHRVFAAPAWVRAARGAAGLIAATLLLGCSSLPPNVGRTESVALPPQDSAPLSRLLRASRPANASARDLTGVRLLGSVESAYGSRMALIQNATRSLDLQYYSIQYDSSTEPLLEALRQAARRGVRVRILVDDFNAAGRNAPVLDLYREPGIEVRTFNPISGPRQLQASRLLHALFDLERMQKRMHNKVFIADNALAITGGRNLGNEYFGQSTDKNFLDLDVLVSGRVVGQLSRSFDRYWADPLAYPIQLLTGGGASRSSDLPAAPSVEVRSATLVPTGESEALRLTPATEVQSVDVPGAADVAEDIASGRLRLHWAPAVLLADGPEKIAAESGDDPTETVIDSVVDLMKGTQRDLLVISPYFVPGEQMLETFRGLRARGVRVRVLTNSLASNDAPLAHVGYARWRLRLLEAGIVIHELRASGEPQNRRLVGSTPSSRSSLHTKALVMDGRMLVIGSMNLDLRSKLQNTEVALVIRSAPLAQSVTASIENVIADSYRVEQTGGQLLWYPPTAEEGKVLAPLTGEPDAGVGLQLLLKVIGPLAPDEML